MEITVLYFEDCPNWRIAEARVVEAIAGRGDVTVTRRLVASAEEAERARFHGSPSILIDGVDVFAQPDAPVGLACRRYLNPDGSDGAPSLDRLRAALDEAS